MMKEREIQVPKKILIRPARPKDAPVAARLMYYAASPFFLAIFGEPESYVIRILRRAFRLPYHASSYRLAFVAEIDGKVVGLFLGFAGLAREEWEAAKRGDWIIRPLWLFIVRPWRIPRMSRINTIMDKVWIPVSDEEYYIEHLAILPEWRRQGIGKRLVEFATAQARAKGLKRLTLDVEVENEVGRRFWESLGFQGTKTVTDQGFCKLFGIQGVTRMAKPIV